MPYSLLLGSRYASCCNQAGNFFPPQDWRTRYTEFPNIVTTSIVNARDLVTRTYLDPKMQFSTCDSVTYVAGKPQVSSWFFTASFTGTYWNMEEKWNRAHPCSIELDDCAELFSKYDGVISAISRTYPRERTEPRTTAHFGLERPRCRTKAVPLLGCNRCKIVPLRNIKMFYSQTSASRDMCASNPVPFIMTDHHSGMSITRLNPLPSAE
jgi:hypothetical protein